MRAWFARRDALTAATRRQQELLFHVSIYTDDLNKGAIGCARIIRLIMCRPTFARSCVLCTAPHKRGLCTYILSLSITLCHTLRGAVVQVAKVLRTSADVTTTLSREPAVFSMARKVVGLLCHFADALGLPLSLSLRPLQPVPRGRPRAQRCA
jgi:hypothetical protein